MMQGKVIVLTKAPFRMQHDMNCWSKHEKPR